MTITGRTATAVLITVLAGAVFLGGRLTAPQGAPLADAAQLARHAGDSAWASYSKSVNAVIGRLQDSVRYYRGDARAGAQVVVHHDAGAVHDVAPAGFLGTKETSAGSIDTARIPMAAIDSGGIQIAETLSVAPRPSLVWRSLHFSIDPDTILVALLQTKDGLERFTAAGTRAGLHVSVIDAAAKPPSDNATLKAAVTAGAMVGCAVAGYELGRGRDGSGVALAIGGTVCAGGALIRIRF